MTYIDYIGELSIFLCNQINSLDQMTKIIYSGENNHYVTKGTTYFFTSSVYYRDKIKSAFYSVGKYLKGLYGS